nr:cobyrinate a,c-diamide synthase [Gloeothece verrucosa]
MIIAGERSGVGKTTVTLSLLCFLSAHSHQVQSFKVGPDYIDPMYHTAITGRPCRNLDPVLTSETYVQSCFARHCQGVEMAIVEGVMGLFDGIASPVSQANRGNGINDYASTAHIARLLNLPVLLVIDCSRLSGSVAAIAAGYRDLDPRVNLAGVVLNRVGSDRHLQLLQEALETLCLPILGVIRRQNQITLADRHLGLVPAGELSHLSSLFEQLTQLAATSFDWQQLFPLLKTSTSPHSDISLHPPLSPASIKIAVAQDKAFNFYYADNLDILVKLGAELIFWSPMLDPHLPECTQGLYFGGGFPEVFAQALTENTTARASVARAISQGMPTIAECGGLMYLSEKISDFEGKTWPMVGILPTVAIMSETLTLGYRQAAAHTDSLLLKAGEIVCGHEFHRSKLTPTPPFPDSLFEVKKISSPDAVFWEGWNLKKLHASYIHLHFGETQPLAAKFLAHCLAFSFQVR